ncbi:MAG TPA: ANTAR domain-containing protein [Solirubrobacteraceae bacterium]|nr:ANTAR domain-containing protein [Solirubrobacteraceae bacterium]
MHEDKDGLAGSEPTRGLRVLAADEDVEALEAIAAILRQIGHEVSSYAIGVGEAADQIIATDPDLAVVVLHENEPHALDLIDEISEYASGPVIALLESEDPAFIGAAAERGVFAYARPINAATVQSAIEIALRRHAELTQLSEQVGQLEGALERRGVIERAKGILMERHSLSDRAAFELLREQARRANRTVVDLARAVTDGHALLPRRSD